jgi:glycoprotein-N-acetylgalactosamine 3-beta-galactosyltransferase
MDRGKEQVKGLTLNEVYRMERKKQKNKHRHPYLTEEQLRTVEVTKKISTVFEDFSYTEKNHPHKGALDEEGNLGYVHNPIAIRKSPPELLLPDSEKAVCEDDNVWKVIRKVKVAPSQIEGSVGVPRAKIFCTAYTIERNHDKIPAIRETWGQRCDGFMIPSTVTNVSLDTVNILHLGEEEYWNIWQKVRSIWAYIYDHYYNDYDWFHFAGEDQYVIVENLRMYVESETIRSAANGGKDPLLDWAKEYQTPLYLGRRLAEHARLSLQYNHGGPGYTLNKV